MASSAPRSFPSFLVHLSSLLLAGALAAQGVGDYDVVWRTPSRDASGSMPIGNGEVGCNVWCEPNGRLCFYVSRTDSFSEASRLLKLGKVVIEVTPRPAGTFFEQRLVLQEGRIQVTLGDGDDRVVLNVFVDSDSDVVHVTSDARHAHQLRAQIVSWRLEGKRLRGDELAASWTMKQAPDDVVVSESADEAIDESRPETDAPGRSVPASQRSHVGWVHRNGTSVAPATAARQSLPAEAVADVLQRRAFGLLTSGGQRLLAATPPPGAILWTTPEAGTHQQLRIAAPCLQETKRGDWTNRALALLAATDSKVARERTAAFWRAFWARAWVFVAGDAQAAAGVPKNTHPLRIGVDSGGGNRFVGSIAHLRVDGDPLRLDDPNASLARLFYEPEYEAARGTELPVVVEARHVPDLTKGLYVAATITQDEQHPIGRIVDKVTAGTSDGFLFDTHPGRSLRLIVGSRQLLAKDVLTPGKSHEVTASFDAATGRMQIACDGMLVADSDLDGKVAGDPRPASRLTQALILQRWIQACGGRGAFPIKFNGSIFTVEPKFTGGGEHDADWRKWGDCFWWQNTRLPYHPMLAQGDFDMQAPLFAFYRRTLPVAIARAQAWHGVDGAYWPEVMTPFGTHANGDYGWDRKDQPVSKVLCPWWEYARNQGLELLALLLDHYEYTRDDGFFREQVVPIAIPVLAWFRSAYPRTADGKLRVTPTQALETHWHEVENDLPTVAGLHWCLRRLRTLAPQLVPPDQLIAWAAFEQQLPPIPMRSGNGAKLLAPAAAYDASRQNCESPELYAVFPFRLFGLGKPDLEVARATYAARHDRFTNGWPQDGQDAALLGLVDEAKANVLAKVQNANAAHRFPAMWGPNFDWCPDQCHGSNLLDTVQRMLLQGDDGKLRVLPCWPKDWDVSFRLHAPNRTVVECVFRGGKIVTLEVTPKERAKDVVLPD